MTIEAVAWWALVLAEVVALVLAIRVSWPPASATRQRSSVRERVTRFLGDPLAPLVLLVAYALVDEVAVELLRRHLGPLPRPFAGNALALYHLSNAIVLGWPAALAAASWKVFAWPAQGRRAVLIVAACWACAAAAMVIAYPLGRESAARAIHAFEAGCVVAALVSIKLAWGRPWIAAHVGVGLLVVG